MLELGPTLDVAIGLVFIFVLFSSLLSVLFEALASILDLRSKALENAVVSLIEDWPAGTKVALGNWEKFVGLFGSQMRIRAAVFKADIRSALSKRVYDHPLIGGLSVKNKPSYVPAASFSAALLFVLREGLNGSLASQAEQGIAAIGQTNPTLCRALTTMAQEAQGDWDKLKSSVEAWFDAAMDRLSGDYKRFHQVCAFTLGLVVAILCNVDTVRIVRQLYAEPGLRGAMTKDAGDYLKAPTAASDPSVAAQIAAVGKAQARLLSGSIPVGWARPPRFGWQYVKDIPAWAPVWLGWFVTALAGMLGAPFWFNTLQKLVNLRGSGPKPKSGAEAAADA